MVLMRLDRVLAISKRLETHQVYMHKRRGELEEFEEGMHVIFVSHGSGWREPTQIQI
jgi:hypothetical protein